MPNDPAQASRASEMLDCNNKTRSPPLLQPAGLDAFL